MSLFSVFIISKYKDSKKGLSIQLKKIIKIFSVAKRVYNKKIIKNKYKKIFGVVKRAKKQNKYSL